MWNYEQQFRYTFKQNMTSTTQKIKCAKCSNLYQISPKSVKKYVNYVQKNNVRP